MHKNPVRFVCPVCGVDASEFVDGLVRRELGQTSAPGHNPVDVLIMAQSKANLHEALLETPPPPRSATVLRQEMPAPGCAKEGVMDEPDAQVCSKHAGELATAKCYICAKPICPKCMQLFGYVCSPLCKARADSRGIHVPVYAGQRSLVEARRWRRIGWAATALGVAILGMVGFWVWYAAFGSKPRVVFSVRFPQPAFAGQSLVSGKEKDQLIFLHGGTLARYDLKKNQKLWSLELLDRKAFADLAAAQAQALQQGNLKLRDEGADALPPLPSPDELNQAAERTIEQQLALHVRGKNIWVVSQDKVTLFDWETGNPAKEFAASARTGALIASGDEVLLIDAGSTKPVLTHLNLGSCESRTEDLSETEAKLLVAKANAGKPQLDSPGGLPVNPGKDMGQPLDPTRVAAQVQRMSTASKTALPAVLANSINQERALAELNDDGHPKPASETVHLIPHSDFSLVPDQDAPVQMSLRLVEAHVIQHNAMKAAPTRSAFGGAGVGLDTTEASNELLNQVQRERGGEAIEEDMSRYQVTLRGTGSETSWTGEVAGPPRLFPLQTVNVLAVGKTIIVFDKANKKLWQNSLTYDVGTRPTELERREPASVHGPCLEHKGSLYVVDEGKLTAFDLPSGNVRWGLPSVGVSSVFFDDQNMMYVNSTTASPESIKYKRQINLSDKVNPVVLKVDSRIGAILWQAESVGQVSYVSGKFIYAVQIFEPSPDDDNPLANQSGAEPSPYVHIRRLDPRNGQEIWDHFQERAPLDVAFDQNMIRLVFKKEVQVLKFLSFR
jgi:hypothetical protein